MFFKIVNCFYFLDYKVIEIFYLKHELPDFLKWEFNGRPELGVPPPTTVFSERA